MKPKTWAVFEKSQRREIQKYTHKQSADAIADLLNEINEEGTREYVVWEEHTRPPLYDPNYETRGRHRDEYIEKELSALGEFLESTPIKVVSSLLKVPVDSKVKKFAQKVRVSHSLKDLKVRFPNREFHVLCGSTSLEMPQGYVKLTSKEASDD